MKNSQKRKLKMKWTLTFKFPEDFHIFCTDLYLKCQYSVAASYHIQKESLSSSVLLHKNGSLHLRQFFEVARLELLQNPDSHLIPGIAYRKLSEGEGADYALYAWAQRAKLEARKIPTHSIHVGKLKDQLGEIRKMTAVDPAVFCPRLRELFANCGVALVFLPHIGGSFLHGATFYDGNKIVLGMTVRGKDADRFWFSLFHEIAHVIYGHMNQPHGTSREDEAQADQFAEDALIPNHAWNAFLQSGDFSQSAIVKFARAQEIDPGIVVGRLQKEGCIGYNRYNDMKKKYEIV